MPIQRSGDTEGKKEPETAAEDETVSLFGGSRRVQAPAAEDDTGATEPLGVRDRVEPQDEATRVVGAHQRGRSAAGGAQDEDPMADPPVGWLVVVGGPGKGRVLRLGNGLNIIGRSAEMRVSLDFGDANISRVNHARIVYEPRERRFLLMHGDGTNLTYLNGELVMASVEIASGNEIQLGDTTLRFQALCGPEFDWPDLDD